MLNRQRRRWTGGADAVSQPATLDQQPIIIAWDVRKLNDGGRPTADVPHGDGFPFAIDVGGHLYLVQTGNNRRFAAEPPTTALEIAGGVRLKLRSRLSCPLPRGCQLWTFAYLERRLVGRCAINLAEPVAQATLDLPSGDIQLCFALRLMGEAIYCPTDLALSIDSSPFPMDAAEPAAGPEADRVDAIMSRVEALRRSGDRHTSETLLIEAFGETPTLASAARLLAQSTAVQQADLAVDRWAHALAVGESERDLRAFVEACLKAGRPDQALHRLGLEAGEIPSWSTERLRSLARVQTSTDRFRDAAATWTMIAEQFARPEIVPPDVLRPWAEATVALAESGVASRPARRRVPPSPPVRNAEAYHDLGLREDARSRLEQAARDGQDTTNALWALVDLESRAGRPDAALDALEALIGQDAAPIDADWLRPALMLRAGRIEEARRAVTDALQTNPGDNLFTVAANLAQDGNARLDWISRIFENHGLDRIAARSGREPTLDVLTTTAPAGGVEGPMVTVLVPTFNAETTLATSLASLETQTWKNIEVLILDDASTDRSTDIARTFSRRDGRFRLIGQAQNRGPYHGRNTGLAAARGTFVTCQDADDWSHPRRIEIQVKRLIERPGLIANLSRCLTVSDTLICTPRSARPGALRWNLSSLTFRREPVIERAGYWQEVRFAGDGEFIARLTAVFGPDTIGYLADGPLALVRQTQASLTASAGGGIARLGHTARHEYRERYRARLRAGFVEPTPPHQTPPCLSAPPTLLGKQAPTFDVVLASDFCLPGGTTASNIQEILANRAAGLKTGLLQMHGYRNSVHRSLSPKIRALIDDDHVRLITADESVESRVIVLRWPPVLSGLNEGIASVRADALIIVANQTPQRTDADGGEPAYDPVTCDEIARLTFGLRPLWAPIGPVVRHSLAPFASVLDVAAEDWVNVIDAGDWTGTPVSARKTGVSVTIGRHSRDAAGKWPSNPHDLLAVYPEDGSMDVRILGGAETVRGILGRLPASWTVHGFDDLSPTTFLRSLDYFVYFADARYTEAFGRTIVEAMASRTPVILPSRFRETFGSAAAYAEPDDVAALIRALETNADRRGELVRAGTDFVSRHGYCAHYERLRKLGVDVTIAPAKD